MKGAIRRAASLALPPLVPLIAVLAALEALVALGWIKAFLLPPPSTVFASMIDDREELLAAFQSTTISATAGLAASFVVGTGAAIVLSSSSALRRAFYPYAIFFQTVPIISIAPLLVIWFGFGQPTVIASAFIVSIFPVIASTLLGLQSTDPALVDLFRLHSAPRLQYLFKLKMPYALPQMFSGLRIGAGLAVIGAIVGEFIAGGGLGAVVDAARTQQRVDKVFAAVLMSSLLGVMLVGAINFLGWISLRRWHASARARE